MYFETNFEKKTCCDVVGLILRTSNRGSKKEDTVYDFEIWYNSITKNIKNTCAKKKQFNNKSWCDLGGIGIVAALRETNLARFDFQAWHLFPFTASRAPRPPRLERCPTSWKNGVWPKNRMGSSSSRSFRFNGLMDPSFGFRSGLAA